MLTRIGRVVGDDERMIFGIPDWFLVVIAIVLIGHLALKALGLLFAKAVMSSPEVKAAIKKAAEMKNYKVKE